MFAFDVMTPSVVFFPSEVATLALEVVLSFAEAWAQAREEMSKRQECVVTVAKIEFCCLVHRESCIGNKRGGRMRLKSPLLQPSKASQQRASCGSSIALYKNAFFCFIFINLKSLEEYPTFAFLIRRNAYRCQLINKHVRAKLIH